MCYVLRASHADCSPRPPPRASPRPPPRKAVAAAAASLVDHPAVVNVTGGSLLPKPGGSRWGGSTLHALCSSVCWECAAVCSGATCACSLISISQALSCDCSCQPSSVAAAAWAAACARTLARAVHVGATAAAATITAGALGDCHMLFGLQGSIGLFRRWCRPFAPLSFCYATACTPDARETKQGIPAPHSALGAGSPLHLCSLDKGHCVAGMCADLSWMPQAQAPPVANGSTSVGPNKPGRSWH